MSNYQNSQPYYQPNAYGAQPHNTYTISNNSQPGPPRRSSFDNGDDSAMFAASQHQAQSAYHPYGPSPPAAAAATAPPQSYGAPTALPYRTPSQSQLGAYQHQSQPAPPPHATYNPAQYQTQGGYNPQAYASPPHPYSSGAYQPSAYQPYVPAAYGDHGVNRTASMYNSSHYATSPPSGYGAAPAPAPPPRAERPSMPQSPGHSYGSDVSQSYPYQSNQYLARPSPPAPAPPPHQDALAPARGYSHSSSTYDQYADPYSYSSQSSSEVHRNHSTTSRTSGQYSSSPQPSSAGLPSRNPSQGGNPLGRHPQGSTLPGLPSESESDSEPYRAGSTHPAAYDDLMHTLDVAIGTHQPRGAYAADSQREPLFSPASPPLGLSPDERPTHNGVMSSGDHNINYAAFANDSDAEAAAGLAAMQAADEQEAAEEARRRSSHLSPPVRSSDHERSDDSDYAGYGDLSLAGGGYAGTMHYGDIIPALTTTNSQGHTDALHPRMSSMRSSGVSSDAPSYDAGASLEPPPFLTLPPDMARVDEGGTGGLTEPSPHPRRLSYEDGDETGLSDYADGGDGIPDLFFHPGMSSHRPLPPPPPPARSGSDEGPRPSQHLSAANLAASQNRYSAYDTVSRLSPTAPEAYDTDSLSPSMVPRSTSLASNRSQPRPDQPTRSKTDADRARALKQQAAAAAAAASKGLHDGYGFATPKSDMGTLDLPAIPRKRFDPGKISTDTFKRCAEPWAMSAVFDWLRSLTDDETDLKETTVADAIAALFCHKVPTMSSIDAEALAQQFVQDMYRSGVLTQDEEWVKFAPTGAAMSGVLYQLTGWGCYSSRLHLAPGAKGRCYAHLCMRTVKKADFVLPDSVKETNWVEYWGITKDQLDSRGRKERERQFNLREVVYSEEGYLYGLELLRSLYKDRLAQSHGAIIPSARLAKFVDEVFSIGEKAGQVNRDYLLPQLKYRENEQGPWVAGYSDILREWIKKARPIYVEFAGRYPQADSLIREEMQRNPAFATFLDEARREAASNRLGWDNYLKSPIQRPQRLVLQLETIMKNTQHHSDEKTGLAFAIDEIRAAVHEMNARAGEVERAMELTNLQKKLRLKKHPGDEVDLALTHLGRTVVMKGDMMRQGGKGVSWVPCHAILFDHYLVLAKPGRDSYGHEAFDVSKPPIPMGLISLESTNDPAVMRSSVRGVTTVATPAAAGKALDPRLARTTSAQSGSTLTHTPTGLTQGSGGSGPGSIVTTTVLDDTSKEDKIYYPFKIKHLGRPETYTLYCASADKRQEWCEAIISAKTQHAEALHAQNAEPFQLRVLADTAFGVDSYAYGPRRVFIRGTPLDRAIQEVERQYASAGRPHPVCRTAVNCATVFQQAAGRTMCAIGTDSGVYVSEYSNPRGWVRVIQMNKVAQIAVLEEFNLIILLADKVLIAYHLDVVCPPHGPPVPQTDASLRKAPQKLSGSKDVGFFLAGKMKDRMLVFYQKRDGINSIFKILEPVLQKSATSRSRWLGNASRRGATEFFREYDEFYIPAETYGLHAFHSSLAVATKRGMEVLTLDRKIAWGVPNLDSAEDETRARLNTIAARLKDLRPLGMFRLSDTEFLVAFSECAVYVNKMGDISRSVIMEFVGRANTACLSYPYLILFNDDFVEIRDAQNGRMKQVIAGRDIRMLDDGGNLAGSAPGGANGLGTPGGPAAPKTVKLCMQHPEHERNYVVVEMLMRTTPP